MFGPLLYYPYTIGASSVVFRTRFFLKGFSEELCRSRPWDKHWYTLPTCFNIFKNNIIFFAVNIWFIMWWNRSLFIVLSTNQYTGSIHTTFKIWKWLIYESLACWVRCVVTLYRFYKNYILASSFHKVAVSRAIKAAKILKKWSVFSHKIYISPILYIRKTAYFLEFHHYFKVR